MTTKHNWHIQTILEDLEKAQKDFKKLENCVTFFGSARFDEKNSYYKQAYLLSKMLSEKGFNILSGGASGIMEAANKGAFEHGKTDSIGLNIKLPFEQSTNSYTTKNTTFNHLFIRKIMLIRDSLAFVICAGGFGTLDELFEVLTRIQTKVMTKRPIFLVGVDFWQGLYDFLSSSLVENKTIAKEDLNLLVLTDDLDFVVNEIIKFKKNS